MSNEIAPNADNQPAAPQKSLVIRIRNRIIEGLLLALPVVITFWIIHWFYSLLKNLVIDPVAKLVMKGLLGGAHLDKLPEWFEYYVAPAIAAAIVLILLYVLGWFLHSRLHKAFDWLMLQVPIVTTIYSAVRKMFSTLQAQRDTERFKRVVLVPFPHPGMKVPAFVTSSTKDVSTGRTILCVYVPTTPVPTSGYMLMIPEDEVTELSWDLNETLQAIVSGGISVPPQVEYFPTSSQ